MSFAIGSTSETMVSDVEEEEKEVEDDKRRFGLFAVIHTPEDFITLFPSFLEKFPLQRLGPLNMSPANALHVCIRNGGFSSDSEASAYLSNFLSSQEDLLLKHGMRRVTVLVGEISEHLENRFSMSSEVEKTSQPDNLSSFTFRCGDKFHEDQLLRHIEAPHAFHLDLPRLANFTISLAEGMLTPSGHIHLYKAIPEGKSGPVSYFSRMVSFLADMKENNTETLFIDALDMMTLVKGRDDVVH
jgi:acetyl-CoA carboxylase/biotin carboxylase 1